MKFRLVGKDLSNVNAYGHEGVSTGDVISLDGHLAQKALKNPNYELVKEEPKRVVKKAAKKK